MFISVFILIFLSNINMHIYECIWIKSTYYNPLPR